MTEAVKNQAESFLPKQKKAYQPPELVSYGTVADLTASTSANSGGDSSVMPNKS
jgi:hypothetical protein